MIATFLLSNWRLVAILALAGSTALMTHLWLGAEHGKTQLEIEFKLKVAQAQAETQEVKDRSNKTLEKINADHSIQLAQAEKNAIRNYTARYGTGGLGLPNVPGVTAYASAANGAQVADANACQCVADPAFVRACADDAFQVTEWQRWTRLNHLPVEGE